LLRANLLKMQSLSLEGQWHQKVKRGLEPIPSAGESDPNERRR